MFERVEFFTLAVVEFTVQKLLSSLIGKVLDQRREWYNENEYMKMSWLIQIQ